MAVKKINKEEIVRISIEVFRKQGYNKTSMNDLAIACGLHKGSFYHYFNSKESLMLEILTTLHHHYKNKLFSIAFNETLSPRQRMELFFNKQEPIFTQNMTGCLFGNITLETISVEEEFKEIIQQFFSDWIEAFRYIFLSEKNDEATAENLAQQSVMEIEGALMMMRVFGKVELLKSACNRILNLLKQ